MFETKSVKMKDFPEDMTWGAGFGSEFINLIVWESWGLTIDRAVPPHRQQICLPDGFTAFSYLFRRFGTPAVPCDPDKKMGQWFLSTPIDGFYITAYPCGGSQWGYACTSIFNRTILKEMNNGKDSQFMKNLRAAISETAIDLLRYTYVSDSYFNPFGWQNKEMDDKLIAIYGLQKDEDWEEGDDLCCVKMYTSFTDPNLAIPEY